MNILEIISGVLLIISCVAIVVAVMFQETKSGLSGTVGGTDSFFAGNKSMTNQAILRRITKIAAIALVVLTLIVNAINIWVK